jgi:hypothetical protein
MSKVEEWLNYKTDEEASSLLMEYYREFLGLTEFEIQKMLSQPAYDGEMESFYKYLMDKYPNEIALVI